MPAPSTSNTPADAIDPIFINRPVAREYSVPYKAPPEPANPALRGVLLDVLANLLASSGFIQSLIWQNAGFNKLRDRPELDGMEPRYEPTVIRSGGRRAVADQEQFLRGLADEDWTAKRPRSNAFPSALDFHEAYKSGVTTPSAVAEALLPLIRRDVEHPTTHSVAFLSTKADLVRRAARASTLRYANGTPLGPLDGVPVAVKDEQDLAGYPKSLGSKMSFARSDDDDDGGTTTTTTTTSFCVQKWLDAGAVCLGKTTMHELGCDTTTNNPVFGTPLNPYCEDYYCGGSSGGSAYAVAAGLMPFTMGNDGGGSVRIPANYCGLFGLKTSHGRVSRYPSSNLAKSTGVAGPLAANMIDLELSYRVMAQPAVEDGDSALFVAPESVKVGAKEGRKKKKVLGIYRTWFDRADGVVQKACWRALDYLTSELGYEVVEIDIPLIHDGQMAHAMTIMTEIASGIPSVKPLSPATKIWCTIGKKHPGVDFLQAQKLRNLLMRHLAWLFDAHPGLVIVTPTTPNAGWPILPGDLKAGLSDANKLIRNMEYVYLANFTGIPAISMPVGFAAPAPAAGGNGGGGKVPISLMGMAEWCAEDALLAFGYDVERWLNEGLEGGRPRPGNFVDVLEMVREGGRQT